MSNTGNPVRRILTASLIGTTIEFLIFIYMLPPPYWFFQNCFSRQAILLLPY